MKSNANQIKYNKIGVDILIAFILLLSQNDKLKHIENQTVTQKERYQK